MGESQISESDITEGTMPLFAVRTPTKQALRMGLCAERSGVFVVEANNTASPLSSYGRMLVGYMIDGSIRIDVQGNLTTLSKGQFCMLDCVHPYRFLLNGFARLEWIEINGVSVRAFVERLAPDGVALLRSDDPQGDYRLITKIILDMGNGVGSEAEVNREVTDLLYDFAVAREHVTDKDAATIQEAMAYIRSHFTQRMTVEAIAARFGMNVFRFIRSFERFVGQTPYAYLASTRISAAKRLLVDSTMHIEEISRLCGFFNVTAFGIAFKKDTGFTPYQWRRQHQFRARRRTAKTVR